MKDAVPSAAELHIPAFLGDYALEHQGLVLVTGSNGYGKSTTMAWMIEQINHSRRANVITIEDPIELHFHHRLSNINQREVGTDTHSLAEGLRHVVRQNPDVIVMGERRDHESIATALTTAVTEHLVLATMHTLNATAAVDRMVDFFPGSERRQIRGPLAEALFCVFSQPLLEKGHGAGRVLAWEKVSSSIEVKKAIRDGRIHTLRAMMQSNHEEFVPIEKNLAELVASALVTREEALRWTDQVEYLDDLARLRRSY